jgi:hypothetical protein
MKRIDRESSIVVAGAVFVVACLLIAASGGSTFEAVAANGTLTPWAYLPFVSRQEPPTPTPTPWEYAREFETCMDCTVGTMIYRENACGKKVRGQFGCIGAPPWSPKAGYVRCHDIPMPQVDHLYLVLRYSKHSPPTVPIEVFMDNEPTPRASLIPDDQRNWNSFAWTPDMDLGSVGSGIHSIKFHTEGQKYGVADLDCFILANLPIQDPGCPEE